MVYLDIDERENFIYDIQGLVTSFYPGEPYTQDPCESLLADDKLLKVTYPDGAIEAELIHGVISIADQAAADYSDRKAAKSVLKRLIYGILKSDTGKTLPWGTLTGIRPVKIAMGMLGEGKSPEEITGYMQGNYLVSPKKTALSLEIAQREKALIESTSGHEGYSLYAGIPFCPTRCAYCSFTAYPLERWASRMDEYIDALCAEIDCVAELFAGRRPDTVYIGGGTPTTLTPECMERLFGKIEEVFGSAPFLEWTVEAGRPDSIVPEKLEVMRRHNISRISINPQSMNARTLELIGRKHTPAQIVEAFNMARGLGFDNINMDLILGLPEEGPEEVRRTMDMVARLGPDSVTVHSLAIKRAARLTTMKEAYEGLRFENTEATMEIAADGCRDMGLLPYYLYRQKNMAGNFENVGYAAPGKEGLYNILIMEETQSIAAVGAGATSKRVFADGRIARSANVKDIAQYLERTGEMLERKRRLFEGLGLLKTD